MSKGILKITIIYMDMGPFSNNRGGRGGEQEGEKGGEEEGGD
jgi:hypothetical protein